MNYESPFNMLLGGTNTYELLWEYADNNFIESTLENAVYDVGTYINIDSDKYAMLYMQIDNYNIEDSSFEGNMRTHILINDPSIPYQYIISDGDSSISKGYRFVTVAENGLYFSKVHAFDGHEDDSNPRPYRIYGIC